MLALKIYHFNFQFNVSRTIFKIFLYIHTQSKTHLSQLIFTCSKPTIETLEKGVKYVLVFLLLILNICHTFF